MDRETSNYWMQMALEEAHTASQKMEVPVGAVMILDNKIISRSHNKSISSSDPCAHAEINCIREAARKINNYRLNEAILFVTLEPCAMCLSAVVHARLKKVFFGAFDQKTGACGSCIDLLNNKCFNHTPEIEGGLMKEECSKILKNFFISRRN